MSGKRSLDKGQRFERLIVQILKVCFPDAHRGQQAHNPRHADIEGTPFRIEAKHWARIAYADVLRAIEQAEENGSRFNDDRIPVAITKLDNTPPIVSLKLNRFVQLVERHFYSPKDPDETTPIYPGGAYAEEEGDE
jgi:hypothetical protein